MSTGQPKRIRVNRLAVRPTLVNRSFFSTLSIMSTGPFSPFLVQTSNTVSCQPALLLLPRRSPHHADRVNRSPPRGRAAPPSQQCRQPVPCKSRRRPPPTPCYLFSRPSPTSVNRLPSTTAPHHRQTRARRPATRPRRPRPQPLLLQAVLTSPPIPPHSRGGGRR